jgi:hypothetical protein
MPKPVTENPDNQDSKSLTEQIKAHPGIALAGGLALGVLASALLPRGSARRLAKGAVAAATVGSEAGFALARQARERARSAAGEAGEHLHTLEEKAGDGARQLRQRAAAASGSAAGAGIDTVRAAIRLLGSLRR